MNGSRICVIAMIVPVWLLMSASRPAFVTIPDQTRRSLMTPCCCKSTFQAEVRTRSEVQNGRRTRIMSTFALRIGRLASRKATG